MKKVILTLALLGFSLNSLAAQSLKATVNGMVCAFCAQGIEKRLSKMDATRAVFVDLKNKVVAVEAKPGKTLDQKAIAAEIADAGYDVVSFESSTQTVEEIRTRLKAPK